MPNYKIIPNISEPPLIGSSARADQRHQVSPRNSSPISGYQPLSRGPYTFVTVAQADLCQEILTRTEEFDKTPAVTSSARPAFGSGIAD